MYYGQIEEVADIKKSYHKDSTEALIMAAHEQALSIRLKAGVYGGLSLKVKMGYNTPNII